MARRGYYRIVYLRNAWMVVVINFDEDWQLMMTNLDKLATKRENRQTEQE